MKMVQWSDRYLIGVDRIDFEHRIFVDLIKDFEKAILENLGKDYLEDTLNEIILYARFHFRSEENMMRRIGFPTLAAHRDIHYHLVDLLNNKMTALSMGTIQPIEVLNFLVDWFVNHTTLEDSKIAAFINGR
jgi:hemerythrin